MKNIYKSYHTIEDILYSTNRVILVCFVSTQKFDNLKGFWSSVVGDLKFVKLSIEDGLVKYQVELYKEKNSLTSKREEFYAILKNGKKERVWKPAPSLKENALPIGYNFTNRYLNLSYQKDEFSRISVFTPILKNIEYTNSVMKIQGYLFLPMYGDYDISKFKVKLLKFREEEISFEFLCQLTLVKNREIFGFFTANDFYKFNDVKVLLFDTEIDLAKVSAYSGIFNLVIENSGETHLIQNYHTSFEKEEKTFTYNISENHLALFNFYYDDIVTVWRFEIYHMRQSEYLLLSDLKNIERNDTVWLIGEYTVSARDNGMHFYHYMLDNHPEIDVYYVIEKTSKDIVNLNSSKIIEYGSYKHFQIASKAKVLVFSHMANYLIPKINTITAYKNRYKAYLKVFLQHGVIATTTSMSIMRKEIRQYNLFNVSSEFEKKIITTHLGYNNDDVMVTGLPRWDRLYTEKRTSNTLLIIPTYRNDLEQATDEIFIESDYFKFWNALLTNQKLIKYIEDNNIKIHFFIHIILSRFINKFSVNSKNILLKNSDNLQDLLLNCGMLVTDYSSVSFDALFQNKPVVYVPFDFNEMVSIRGGEQYIDYKKDLAGEVCITVDETVNEIIARVESGWIIDNKYKDRRLKFFKHIDAKNAKRVYDSIILQLYSKYNKNEIVIHKLNQLKDGNLHFEIVGRNEYLDKCSGLLFESRKTSLKEESISFIIELSSCKKEEDLFFLTFLVSLEKLSFDTQSVIHTWDVSVLLGKEKYRIKSFDKWEKRFKNVYHDLIPYSTLYNNFSLMSIRRESKQKISNYKKSITFVLVRIDYKGGVTKTTIDLANILAENSYKVTIVALNVINKANNYFISDKVSFDYVSLNMHTDREIIPSNAYSKVDIIDRAFVEKMNNYFINLHTDFVYFPIYGSSMFITLLEAMPSKVKKIIGDHSGRRYRIYDKLLQKGGEVSFRELRNLTTDYHYLDNLEKIDAIHVINPLVKPIYEQITDKPIWGIPNIVNVEGYLIKEDVNQDWKQRKKIIIAVGSLVKGKNFETLIKAFYEISTEFPNWILEIYGEGEEEKNLHSLIEKLSLQNRVYLKGFSGNIIKKFKQSMLHISVSHLESFGLTIVEAMSQRTLMLSTYTTIGAKFLIEDEVTGFLARSNKQEDVSIKLQEVLRRIDKNDPILFKIQENAYIKSQQFNASSIVKEWDNKLLK